MAWKCKTVGTYDAKLGKFRKPSPWYRKGVADILGIYNGKFLAIEVKSLKGKPSMEQTLFLNDITREGGIALIARSVQEVADGLGLKVKL